MHTPEVPMPERSAQDALRIQVAAVAGPAGRVDRTGKPSRTAPGRAGASGRPAGGAPGGKTATAARITGAGAARPAPPCARNAPPRSSRPASCWSSANASVGSWATEWKDLQSERKRFGLLRQRLRQRARQHWDAEQAKMQAREDRLAAERHNLDHDVERLHQEKEALAALRLRCNGEFELGRRQLHEAAKNSASSNNFGENTGPRSNTSWKARHASWSGAKRSSAMPRARFTSSGGTGKRSG